MRVGGRRELYVMSCSRGYPRISYPVREGKHFAAIGRIWPEAPRKVAGKSALWVQKGWWG